MNALNSTNYTKSDDDLKPIDLPLKIIITIKIR